MFFLFSWSKWWSLSSELTQFAEGSVYHSILSCSFYFSKFGTLKLFLSETTSSKFCARLEMVLVRTKILCIALHLEPVKRMIWGASRFVFCYFFLILLIILIWIYFWGHILYKMFQFLSPLWKKCFPPLLFEFFPIYLPTILSHSFIVCASTDGI